MAKKGAKQAVAVPEEAPEDSPGPPLAVLLVFATLGGFAGGLWLRGDTLLAASATGYLLWSVLFGLLVLVPIMSEKAVDRLMNRLSNPSARDRTLILATADRLMTASAVLLERDDEAGANARRFFRAASRRFLEGLEASEAGVKGGIRNALARKVSSGMTDEQIQDEAASMFAEGVIGRIAPDHVDKAPLVARWFRAMSSRGRRRGRQGEQESASEGDSIYGR